MNHNWSAAECSRDKPPFSFVRGQDSTTWDIVWVSLQGHRSVSVSRHFLLQAPQCPCSMQKRFSRDHCCRGRLNVNRSHISSQSKTNHLALCSATLFTIKSYLPHNLPVFRQKLIFISTLFNRYTAVTFVYASPNKLTLI